jgi:ribosomal protein L37AE/L43A
MKIKFCPNCGKNNIINVRGDSLLWKCVDCGLEMPIFPEKEINKKQTNPKQLNLIKNKS